MSARDSVNRRRYAIECLKNNMQITNEGWTLNEMVTLILREYGHGITDKTAIRIIEQLTKYKELYRRGGRWYLYKSGK